MFASFKKLIGIGDTPAPKESVQTFPKFKLSPKAPDLHNKVSVWANIQGLAYSARTDGRGGHHLEGTVAGKVWRMEQGKPSRDFIHGIELRARAELDLAEDAAVMVMTRALKNDLDKRAFALYTDTLQTTADPNLPEEMRWLSIYEEVGWESLGDAFLNDYAILADTRDNAMAWISPELADLLNNWPSQERGTPKILMLLRGKAYLRMQYTDEDMATMEHATAVFTTACDLAVAAFGSKE
jgi:hypothetical protein